MAKNHQYTGLAFLWLRFDVYCRGTPHEEKRARSIRPAGVTLLFVSVPCPATCRGRSSETGTTTSVASFAESLSRDLILPQRRSVYYTPRTPPMNSTTAPMCATPAPALMTRFARCLRYCASPRRAQLCPTAAFQRSIRARTPAMDSR